MRRWNDSAFSASRVMPGLACLTLLAATLPACGRRAEELPVKVLPESTGGQATAGATAAASQDKALEPFDPPPLASLNGDSTWIDRPVRDGMAVLREQQAKEPTPGSVAEALASRTRWRLCLRIRWRWTSPRPRPNGGRQELASRKAD